VADPFKIEGPAFISFSGGRTSGYMLRRIIDAYGGTLPSNVHVLFANTGLELEPTLDFVRDVSVRWGIEIIWIEYRLTADEEPTYAVVTHETASRNGEPFALYLDHVEQMTLSKGREPYLPGPGNRFCTTELKIRPMKKWMLAHGHEYWTNVVGIRHDEPKRWKKINRTPPERWEIELPLVDAEIDVQEVTRFWATSDFDLRIAGVWEGNCDACHLKMPWKVAQVFRDRPERAAWWLERERRAGKPFRPRGPSISQLVEMSKRPIERTSDEYEIQCTGCTD
jgi:predicted phosphoadenosine phosphosulfate sulfurtransferase